jgi:hypothetical protein
MACDLDSSETVVTLKEFMACDLAYHRVYSKGNTMGATCGAETAYPFGTLEFTTGF